MDRTQMRAALANVYENWNPDDGVDDGLIDLLTDAALQLCGTKAIIDMANRKVDAILAQETAAQKRVNYPKREALPEPIRELIDAFVEITGIKPLAREVSGWLVVGQDWLTLGTTRKDISGAFEYAKGKYSIMEPASLTKTIRAHKAGALPTAPVAIQSDAVERTRRETEIHEEKVARATPMPDSVRAALGKLKTQLEVT